MKPKKRVKNAKGALKTIHLDEYRRLIEELIKVRKGLKMSQTDVAKKVGWSDHTYISKIETHERRLDVVDLVRLAKAYNKPVQFFMSFLEDISIK